MRYTAVGEEQAVHPPKQNNKRDIVVAVLGSLALTIAVLLYVSLRYQSLMGPDDVGIRNIVSGLFTGTPNAHTYFMHFAVTKPLAVLYTLMPNVYWYYLYLLVVNYSCFGLIMYKILRRLNSNRFILVWCAVIVFLIMWLRFFIMLEWTTTSGIAAATAVFWYVTTYSRKGEKEKLRGYIPCFIMIFVAWNTRNDVGKLAIPFFAAGFIWKLTNKRNIRAMIPFLVICALIMGGSEVLDRMAYSSQEWKEADEFSEYRSTMIDRYGWPDYAENEEVYTRNGITREMYQIIKNDYNLMLVYKGVLKPENFKELAEIAEKEYYAKTDTMTRIKNCITKRWNAINGSLYRLQTLLIYAGFFAVLFYAVRRKDVWKILLTAGTLVGFEMIWIYLYDGNRLPSHVGYSLNMIMIAVLSSFLWKIRVRSIISSVSGRRVLSVVVAVCLTACFYQFSSQTKAENDKEAKNAQMFKIVKEYCQRYPDLVFYRDFYSFNNSSILYKELISAHDEMNAANFIPANGWSVVLPLNNQFLPTDGNTELCRWLLGRNNYYFLVDQSKATDRCRRLVNLFASRGVACNMRVVDRLEIPNGVVIMVYRFEW